VGVQVNTAEPCRQVPGRLWRVFPNEDMASFPTCASPAWPSTATATCAWENILSKKSADRRIGVWMQLTETAHRPDLTVTDEDGHVGQAEVPCDKQACSRTPEKARTSLRENLTKLGDTIFEAHDVTLSTQPSPGSCQPPP
jgi:hypothetical protein